MIREERVLMAMAKIGAGSLPDTLNAQTFGGASNGEDCAVCNGLIAPGATELELEWRVDGFDRKAMAHPICYAAWDEAVRRMVDGRAISR